MITIVIEGTDGCGKQTQSKLLLEALENQGLKCKLQSFPNYQSDSSALVKMYLSGVYGETADCLDAYQASSFYAVDRLSTMKLLEKEDFDILILDRYTSANMVHQSYKIQNLDERDIFLEWLEDFEFVKLALPRPNLTFFLDMPVEKSMELANARKELKNQAKQDIHEKDKEHLSKAYEAGKYVSRKFDWKEINCLNESGEIKSIDNIHKEIMRITENFLQIR